MWKSQTTEKVKVEKQSSADDDWETDPDFVNDISEKETRWGNKETSPEARKVQVDMTDLRTQVIQNNDQTAKDQYKSREGETVKTSYGVRK